MRKISSFFVGKVLLALVTLLLLAAGCEAPGRFTFDVTCDSRQYTPPEHVGAAYFEGVCQAIRDLGPGAFMIGVGDIDPPDRTYAVVRNVLGPDYTWYPVVGNHELEKPEYMVWLREYNTGGSKLPRIVRSGPAGAVETCYSFDYGCAHFAVINQYYDGQRDNVGGGTVSDALYEWLAADLAGTDKRIIFVAGHEPLIAMPDMGTGRIRHQGDSLDDNEAAGHRFWSLLRKHEVTAYLCGHTHNASVAKINGLWQVDAGHARGQGDKGAPSTFARIQVAPEQVICDLCRSSQPMEQTYEKVYSERLR
jgi:hypothetical protein